MKFFLDHDVPRAIRLVLERHGHDVSQVTDVLPRDAPDDAVFARAVAEDRVMVTCNRNDFLELAEVVPHAGLIILIRRRHGTEECGKLLLLLRRAGEDGLRGNVNFA